MSNTIAFRSIPCVVFQCIHCDNWLQVERPWEGTISTSLDCLKCGNATYRIAWGNHVDETTIKEKIYGKTPVQPAAIPASKSMAIGQLNALLSQAQAFQQELARYRQSIAHMPEAIDIDAVLVQQGAVVDGLEKTLDNLEQK